MKIAAFAIKVKRDVSSQLFSLISFVPTSNEANKQNAINKSIKSHSSYVHMQKHSPKHALYGGNCFHFYFCFILKIITSFGFHAERQKNNNQIWMRITTFFVNFVDKAKIRLIVICAFRRHVYVYDFCSLSATIQQFTHLHFNCHCLCKWVILGQVTYFCYRFHGIERDWIARTKQKKS